MEHEAVTAEGTVTLGTHLYLQLGQDEKSAESCPPQGEGGTLWPFCEGDPGGGATTGAGPHMAVTVTGPGSPKAMVLHPARQSSAWARTHG